MRLPGKQDPISWALSALTDNPWTRAWNNLVTEAAIQPVERLVGGAQVVADDTLARLAAKIDGEVERYGQLSPETYALLGTYIDEGRNWGGMADNVAQLVQAEAPADVRQQAIMGMLAKTAYKPGMVVSQEQAAASGLPVRSDEINLDLTDTVRSMVVGEPSRAYTEGGNVMRQYVLGSPTASYLAGGAGLAAAVQGAMGLAETLSGGEKKPPEKKKKEEKAQG